MGFITRYGSFWGTIPQTNGRVFWVAPSATYTVEGRSYSASDSNDGLSPERAFLTLQVAINSCTANVNDVIVMLPGSHSYSASVAVNVAGITITGLPGGSGNLQQKRTSVTTSAADEVMNVTAADVEIAHLNVIVVTAQRGIDYTAAASRLYIHDCSFDMYTAAASTSTIAISSTTAIINCPDIRIENNHFAVAGAQGPCIFTGDSARYVIKGNTFLLRSGVQAKMVECSGVTNQSGLWLGNNFLAAGTAAITTGIEGSALTNTGAVGIIGNFFSFSVSSVIDTFGAGTAYIAENYKANTGAGSGGALVTSIT